MSSVAPGAHAIRGMGLAEALRLRILDRSYSNAGAGRRGTGLGPRSFDLQLIIRQQMKVPREIELPGELKYRPPTGKPEDRMLALATGRTEDGQKIAMPRRQKPEPEAA